jgi:hypothetical protein
MANFTVRIELHGASGEEYEKLHTAMEKAGYRRYMSGTANGRPGIWQLPTAEYDFTSSTMSAYEVRDHAKAIADRVKAGAWCLATEVASRAISSKLLRYTDQQRRA